MSYYYCYHSYEDYHNSPGQPPARIIIITPQARIIIIYIITPCQDYLSLLSVS